MPRRRPREEMPERLIDPTEVAKILGISVGAARKRLQRGQIPCVRLGRLLRVRQRDLTAYLDSLTDQKE